MARILGDRERTGWAPHRLAALTGECRSTVHRVLVRAGRSRLSVVDPMTGEVIRYQRDLPGELLHIDVRKLANYVLARSFQQLLATTRSGTSGSSRTARARTAGSSGSPLTLAREWAYVTAYSSEQERLAALPAYVAWYNSARPHTALDGRPPLQALATVNNVPGHYT